ncbi:MAG: sulfur carrier protein ThiS [Fibrobacter sp.]|nr:sulfur carrier protein ThiS [Fibrobacter sp.]
MCGAPTCRNSRACRTSPVQGDVLISYICSMLTINGQSVDAAGKTVAEYLAEAGYNTVRIAVERNEEIVPKAKYAETVLADGDVVEVVNFVGGG